MDSLDHGLPGDELEGTLGKGTESLLLGDGGTSLRFSSIARQAGTASERLAKPGNPRQHSIYVSFEGTPWTSTPGCGEAEEENGGGRETGELALEGQAPH
ncbi:hypothetical protein KVR01_003648 [Diaporthe batatas]|uniref:uncharacterized protein n=1 Tax=Diaporthe batatas TaxID=748121 RepID=UPI001D04C206|nr:uncharacterized protein KVR01_003648 [Diaporthe batatas]KAG8167959.1 hypothetical protein KVR01_003648 [Diaporthe batatas]